MKNMMRKSIKTLFNLIGGPGIGLPHHGYETALLVAGAKPTAIVSAFEIDDRLKAAIDEGRLLIVGKSTPEIKLAFYYDPHLVKNPQDIQDILIDTHINGNEPSVNDLALLKKCYGYEGLTDAVADQRYRDRMQQEYIGQGDRSECEEVATLLNGENKISVPMLYYPDDPSHKMANERLLRKGLKLIECENEPVKNQRTTLVLAQPGEAEKGKELFARYFNNGEGYEKVEEEDRRVAELLGYTDDDADWFAGNKYQNSIVMKLMQLTEEVRRNARCNYLLMDAEDSNKDKAIGSEIGGKDVPASHIKHAFEQSLHDNTSSEQAVAEELLGTVLEGKKIGKGSTHKM